MNNSSEDYLILVSEDDKPWGKLEKSLVHQFGILHRAFSVFIFNSQGELLLQQRVDDEYHSNGLWSNTYCSHPQYGEDLNYAVEECLMEEMGIECETNFQFSFIYKAEFENGLKEHEFEHVFFGICDEAPILDQSEIKCWKYVDMDSLAKDLIINPNEYTTWLKICFDKTLFYYRQFIEKYELKIQSQIEI